MSAPEPADGGAGRGWMTDAEIDDYPVGPTGGAGAPALARAAAAMGATGQWGPGQAMGRRWPVGCVALEITQRCNLDCSLCYLSEHAEAVHDVPLAELFRRIDTIAATYGPDTDVQVTGGDPTLRDRAELVAIVRRIAARGMRPSLFTNGIRATRSLLSELAAAGLVDVAFHVDMTQARRGFDSEVALNAVRADYIDRARGLGLAVMFNTTVFTGNMHEIPAVARFFVRHADAVELASFQLQADTGRGVLRGRDAVVSQPSVMAAIERGAGGPLSFDVLSGGHAACNRYAAALVADGRAFDLFDDRDFILEIFTRSAGDAFPRGDRGRFVRDLLAWLARRPGLWPRTAAWAGRKLWQMRRELLAARGRVGKISFFVHNFMDACRLERERVDACVFMVATDEGPVSMCLHNARRDRHVLKRLKVPTANGNGYWDPLTGSIGDGETTAPRPAPLPARRRKGRRKQPMASGAPAKDRL